LDPLIKIARQIEEHDQNLALQLEERDRLMEEARVEEEERELFEAEEKQELRSAIAKKTKKPKKTSDDDDDDEEKNTTKATKSRGPNFSAVEDVIICQAYIAALEDPIVVLLISAISMPRRIVFFLRRMSKESISCQRTRSAVNRSHPPNRLFSKFQSFHLSNAMDPVCGDAFA
jgi:hypothetical protein